MSIPRNFSLLASGASAGGVLGVATGGTGVTTLTSGYLVKGNGTSAASASVVYNTGTNVGIGTASPSGQLTVQGAGQATQSFNTAGALGGALVLDDTGIAGNNGGALLFAAASGAWRFAAIKGLLSNGASNTQGSIGFSVRPTPTDANLTEAMRIEYTGKVGIGTSSPTAALHVPGNSTTIAALLTNIAEPATISATAATGTIAFYPSTQSVLYYTASASANWTTNITWSAGTTMNTAMTTGQSVTVVFLVTNGATARYNNVVQVDGTTVTPKWQGGTAPTSGNASSVDVYTYTVFKTGASTFTVFASQTKFA